MKRSMFGSVVASAVAGLMAGGIALATEAKKEEAKTEGGQEHGWCKSNGCGGKIAGAKNSCHGQAACKGITKDACEKDGKGTWSTEAKPK